MVIFEQCSIAFIATVTGTGRDSIHALIVRENDARINYVATRSPISDPLARYNNALAKGRQDMADRHHVYFNPFSDIEEGNPQMILEREEPVELPPPSQGLWPA